MAIFRVSSLLVLLAAVLGALPLAAQGTVTLRGRVVEAGSQRPLNGVQVVVAGANRRAVTNEAGEYSITNLPAGPARVRAELIGHTASEQSVTLAAGQTARADFSLATSAFQLDALVVTGTAGATRTRAIGNAVSTVQAEQIVEKAPVTTVTQLLQGRTAGLTVLPGSGTVGTAANIRIRGAGSLSANNQPVFYIDGVRMSSGGQGGFGTSNSTTQPTSALDAINPEDIESIEIIKGPAAATLYGADAAAGVVQVITKRGRKGQQGTQWSAKAEVGTSEWHLDHPTNYTLCTEAKQNQRTREGVPIWPGCQAVAVGTLLRDNPLERDKAALRTGDIQSYTLSARGGGERYSFYVSGDHEDETGVFFNNFFQRTSARANFSVNPSEKLDFNVSTGYTRSNTQIPNNDNSSNGLLRNAYRGQPGANFPFEEGYRGLGPKIINTFDNRIAAERIVLGATANYRPVTWFRNRLTAGLDLNDRLNTLFFTIDTTGAQPFGSDASRGAVYQFAPETHVWTLDYAGTISNELPREMASDFSFGMQLNARRFESLQGNGVGLTTNQTRLISSAAETRAFESFEEQNSLGFFVQEQLGWRDRLFVTGAVRVDDNSAFGQDFSTVVYPKLSASYVISEEPFFSVPAVDNLKLRAAWGQAGNSPAPFSADQTFEATTVTLADGSTVSGITTAAFGNPNLKAETGQELELGFDASLFNDRVSVEGTFYNKRTNDALIPIPVAPSLGFGGPGNRNRLENLGTISNRGFELGVSGTPVAREAVNWDVRLTASTNRNELVSFGGRDEPIDFGSFAVVQRHIQGHPLAGYWARDVRRDESGRPVLNARGQATLIDSLFYIGPSTPTREVSLSNTVTLFKNVRLYALTDYKGGYYMWNAISYVRNRIDQNTFEVNNPDADPADVAARKTLNYTLPHIQKADFIKLREVSVSYTLPRSLLGRFGTEQATLNLAGRNLAIWTEYGGADPELNFSNDADFSRADYASVPMIRKLVASLSFTF
jgi:TonB-linked SusC/RagA family outer membrane protein